MRSDIWTPAEIHQMRAMRAAGHRYRHIAYVLGKSYHAVVQMRRRQQSKERQA